MGVIGQRFDWCGCVWWQGSAARLPDVAITDKNDTFQPAGGTGASTFRLMAVAARWDDGGATCTPLQGVPAAVSAKFVVSVPCGGWTQTRLCRKVQGSD
jgi:hypothetical protein